MFKNKKVILECYFVPQIELYLVWITRKQKRYDIKPPTSLLHLIQEMGRCGRHIEEFNRKLLLNVIEDEHALMWYFNELIQMDDCMFLDSSLAENDITQIQFIIPIVNFKKIACKSLLKLLSLMLLKKVYWHLKLEVTLSQT